MALHITIMPALPLLFLLVGTAGGAAQRSQGSLCASPALQPMSQSLQLAFSLPSQLRPPAAHRHWHAQTQPPWRMMTSTSTLGSPLKLSENAKTADPFKHVASDVTPLSEKISLSLTTEHPTLKVASNYFFQQQQGKRFRPTIVMLMAQAVAELTPGHQADQFLFSEVYKRQSKLAGITEMIHTASLIHDDVLDEASTRRGGAAVHKMYSNKVAVLAGDYLLARAAVALAQLQNCKVVETMAESLESLVAGEIMQLKSSDAERLSMEHYLSKSYRKTASLIANSCKSAALLSGHQLDSEVAKSCESYGYHLGLSFQIIDDLLDFTSSSDDLGKPGMQDMALGLATAPVLYAAEQFPQMRPMIKRKFKQQGDLEAAYELVVGSDSLQRTRELAEEHSAAAISALSTLPESEAKACLHKLCEIVLTRKA